MSLNIHSTIGNDTPNLYTHQVPQVLVWDSIHMLHFSNRLEMKVMLNLSFILAF
jgi:hypothetical protein